MFNTPDPAQKTAQDVRDDPKDPIPSSEQLPRLPTFEQSLRESCSKEILRPIPQRPSLEGGSQRSSFSVSKSPHRRQSIIHQSPSLHQIAHQQNICCCQFQVKINIWILILKKKNSPILDNEEVPAKKCVKSGNTHCSEGEKVHFFIYIFTI